MKNTLSKWLVSLVCVAVIFTALSAFALADETPPCLHTVKLERPKDGSTTPATCISPASYTVELTCRDCGLYLGEYRQSEPGGKTDPNNHRFTETQVAGECAGAQPITQKICMLCGYTETNTSGSGHNWQTVTVKATTCGQTDYSYEQCSLCQMTKNYKYGSSYFTHTYTLNSAIDVRLPTCSMPGEKTQTCDCGEKTRTIPVAALPHTYGSAVTIEGNCTTKTRTSETCTVCQYEHILSYGSYVHTYAAQEIVAPTCTTTGIRASSCTSCGAEEWRQTLPALGHGTTYWQSNASGHWKTCIRCGVEIASLTGHTGSRANDYCTTKVTCSVCGYVMVPAGKHSASVVNDSGDDTYHDLKCADCSYVSSRVKHTYTAADGDCTAGRICSVCGHRAGGNASHALSTSWTSMGASQHGLRCTYAGCSYAQTENHAWTDWTVTQQPTTTSVGTESRSCTKCSTSMVRSVPKLTASATATSAPTATPTPAPTSAATKAPTAAPTSAPASAATKAPTAAPTSAPASAATNAPTAAPTSAPASAATKAPTAAPTSAPASAATKAPTAAPTSAPASAATKAPTAAPTSAPASTATNAPTAAPTSAPASAATSAPADTSANASSATSAPTENSATAEPAGSAVTATAEPVDSSVPATAAPADTNAPQAELTIAPQGSAENEPITSDNAEASLPSGITAGTVCAAAGVPCTETEFMRAGLLIRVCAVCGNTTVTALFDDETAAAPVFADVPGVTVTGAPQNGQFVLRAAELYDEAAGATDAYLALTAIWEQEGLAQTFDTAVQVSLPLAVGDAEDGSVLSVPTAEFKLVRIDIDEADGYQQALTELDFSYEDGILTFEMDRVAIYLLIPA